MLWSPLIVQDQALTNSRHIEQQENNVMNRMWLQFYFLKNTLFYECIGWEHEEE